MRIECISSFLDGRERYEKGDIFTVKDEAKAAYFVQNGWAVNTADGVSPAAGPAPKTTLTIQSSKIGLGDNHG